MKVFRDPFDCALNLLAEFLHPVESHLQGTVRLQGELQGQHQQQLGQLPQGEPQGHRQQQLGQPSEVLPQQLQQRLEQLQGVQEHRQQLPQRRHQGQRRQV